ncbi:copper resistance protein NlpE [Candidatus Methylomicrobium oryzae]|uniref:copper resistance protein NlpE n=1 Tax=Candidatus Methylomicrobium oryzae TaxID=2802053 RepID=UPI0019226B0D|nr:copper resistance protein NlpE [Methylomicrobium sp. RS1]MBL1262283.1 copper resistance protein NlpE N-terminal domain-containing protein [Methylomicrobium sp. RS1]
MRALTKPLQHNLALFLFSSLLAAMPAMAVSDLEAQEGFARARSKNLHPGMDHSAHQNPADKSQEFRGVFYGYLPCSDCDGVKTTLSLQQKNNYLIVIQPAKQSSREYFERGKYDWNVETRTVVLTPTKGGTKTRRYHIEDEGTLIQLNEDGIKMEDYELQRSDTYKSREVHIH